MIHTEYYMIKMLLISLEKYHLRSSFSHTIYREKGVCIFVRADTSYNTLGVSQFCEENTTELSI